MSMPRTDALDTHPDFPFLDPADVPGIESLMHRLGYLHDGEKIASVEKAGEGNMNLVLRVRTDRRSVVLKQSRPWVEKYDSIAAPWDRVVLERRLYERVRGVVGVAERMPTLLGDDAASRTLLLEDLGEASDLSGVYAGGAMDGDDLAAAAAYLRALHDATIGERGDDFANREMRRLNHAHIYDIPLGDHGMVDLDALEPGLAAAAKDVRDDEAFVAAVRATGERYLADANDVDQPVLLHGDFFPGSLLRAGGKLWVIDPEFCFAGDACFDVGVFAGHLALAGRGGDIPTLLAAYGADDLDAALLARVAGCEVMRRLIGVAQLPLGKTDGRRATLLDKARRAVLDANLDALIS
jgi:5-methylthioribose kinase